jgi:predicted CXXCH cytochrome family protein
VIWLRTLVILTLVIVFTLSLCAVSLAADPIADEAVSQGGYLEPTAGLSPHGDYSATSNKCKTCHAVHGAAVGGEVLLRDTRARACMYCHFGGTFSTKQPYGPDETDYTIDYENNHSASHGSNGADPPYAGCASCHSVHGAGIWSNEADAVTVGMILRDNPGGTVTFDATGSVAGPVTNLDDFCRDCHDGTSNATTGQKCSGSCHTTGDAAAMQVSKFASRNGASHVMTSTLTGNNSDTTPVAWFPSSTCRSCHKGGATYADGNSFPHITSGADFLNDDHTSTSPLDEVCLQCHRDPANTSDNTGSGVGLTY